MKIFISESQLSDIKKALAAEREKVDKAPTQAEKEAGNYRKGHITIMGLDITIENPKGGYRSGVDDNGHEWKQKMNNDYGYFNRTLGKDGDAIDVFIGPNLDSEKIFPIDQFYKGKFDETKVMLGFNTKEEAKRAYLSNYEKGWTGFKYISEVDIETFKNWLYDGYKQKKPFAKYKSLNESYNNIYNMMFEEYTIEDLLQEFISDKKNGIKQKHWNVIPAEQYHNLLKRFMELGEMARIPENVIDGWFKNIIIPNTLSIYFITDLAGHTEYTDIDSVNNVFNKYFSSFSEVSDFLDEIGFYDWCVFPDGTSAYSDFGLNPLISLISQYEEDLDIKDKLILLNRCLDVAHQRGDLASAFIEGGKETCYNISNMKENINYDVVKNYNKKSREDDIKNHGKETAFDTKVEKSKKAYSRKEKHKKPIEDFEIDESEQKRKIYLSESQFKTFCRKLLQERRKKEYIENLIKENFPT